MDARRLLVFRAVARTGSFSAAARDLHLSQPSVSRAVAELEVAAGLSLLSRARGGAVPTDAGRALLVRADVVAGQLERAAEELAAHRRLDAGRVRLGAFPSAAETLGVEAVRALGRRHPGLRVDLRETPAGAARALVLRGELDLALTFALEGAVEDGAAAPELEVRPLLTEDLLLCVPAGHRLAARAEASLAALAEENWVQAPGPGGPRLVEQACRRAGYVPRIAAEAAGTQLLVAAGAGITLVPALARIRARDDVVLLGLTERPRRAVRVVSLATAPAPGVPAALGALAAAAAAFAGPGITPSAPPG